MELAARDVLRVRFKGTRHAYDRREVDAFLERVANALAEHEAAAAAASHDLASARRSLHQLSAAQAASRRRTEVRAAEVPADDADSTPDGPTEEEQLRAFSVWLEVHLAGERAAGIVAAAREERRMIFAVAEECRRELLSLAALESEDLAERAAEAAKQKAARVVNRARLEAQQEKEQARLEAKRVKEEVEQEVEESTLRLAQLRASLAAVKKRIGNLTQATATDLSTINDLIDLDVDALGDEVDVDEVVEAVPPAEPAEPAEPAVSTGPPSRRSSGDADRRLEARLAELRKQLERS